MTPTLYFMGGRRGSGKTTRARQIAAETGAAFFSVDEIVTRDFVVETEDDYHTAYLEARERIAHRARHALREGRSVVFDFGGNSASERSWVRMVAESCGAEHELHFLDVTEEVAIEGVRRRNETRPEGIFFCEVDPEDTRRRDRALKPPEPRENLNVLNFPRF